MQASAGRASAIAEGEAMQAFRQIEDSVRAAVAVLARTADTIDGTTHAAQLAGDRITHADTAQQAIRASCATLATTGAELGRLTASFTV